MMGRGLRSFATDFGCLSRRMRCDGEERQLVGGVLASGWDEAASLGVHQVVGKCVEKAHRPDFGEPMDQHPAQAAVLHLGMHVLGKFAAAIDVPGLVGLHARPPLLDSLGLAAQLRARGCAAPGVTLFLGLGTGL